MAPRVTKQTLTISLQSLAFIKYVGAKYVDAIGYEASFYIASIGDGPTCIQMEGDEAHV